MRNIPGKISFFQTDFKLIGFCLQQGISFGIKKLEKKGGVPPWEIE